MKKHGQRSVIDSRGQDLHVDFLILESLLRSGLGDDFGRLIKIRLFTIVIYHFLHHF